MTKFLSFFFMIFYCLSSLFGMKPLFFDSHQLIADCSFENGFTVLSKETEGAAAVPEGVFHANGTKTPSWMIAQWGKGPDLWNEAKNINGNTLSDGKCRSVELCPEEHSVILSIDGKGAYEGVPADTEEFPHLLLEQSPFLVDTDNVPFYSCDSNHLIFSADVGLNAYEESPVKDGINAVQLLSYFYIKGKNSDDFVWFGLCLFDDRGPQDTYWAMDTAGSNNMIYTLSTRDVYKTVLNGLRSDKTGKRYKHIRVDLAPHIDSLFERINESGVFERIVSKEDFYIGGMNIGFELHGNASCTVRLKNLSLESFRRKENYTVNFASECTDVQYSTLADNGWAARVYGLSDGTFITGYETSGGIMTKKSSDNCETWDTPVTASFAPDKDCANVNFFEFGDDLYLAYRAIGDTTEGYYTSLRVSVSHDMGESWQPHTVICEYLDQNHQFRGVWEPCLGEADGELVCIYANDSLSVTTMQNIESLTFDGEKWGKREIICSGELHDSRDGMPVWTRLDDGSCLMAIEATTQSSKGHPFVISLLRSADGRHWSEPETVYIPHGEGSKAGAPGLCQLADGRIVLTFQTDEDSDEKGDAHSVSKFLVLSPDLSRADAPVTVFGGKYAGVTTWGGVYSNGQTVYYASGSPAGAAMACFSLRDVLV